MVWNKLKSKPLGGKSAVGKEDGDNGSKDKLKKACPKCGEKCKKCGSECKCGVRRVYLRAPMFNYYTDLMH